MINSMMSVQLQTGDAVRVLPTGEIGLLLGINRMYPESGLVSLGAEGLWTFPIQMIDRIGDLRDAFRDSRNRPRAT
jgi:hypothetical protein